MTLLSACARESAEQHAQNTVGAYDTATAEFLASLDEAMYSGKWLLIDADNQKIRWVKTLADAHAAVETGRARTLAGHLNAGMLGADIDPGPDQAVLGDVCAEALVAWCVEHRLRYLTRRSGRPGGWHVYAAARTPLQAAAWALVCARLSKKLGITVDDRTGKVIRTLTAPHRRGLPSPVVSCTLTPAVVAAAVPPRTRAKSVVRASARKTRTRGGDASRSAAEYGRSCAMARAGYTGAQAWKLISGPGAKSQRSERWWRRYIWLPAVTIAAAENGLSEAEAWQAALDACPARFAQIRFRWWKPLWRKALQEAAQERPRRRRVDDAPTTPDPEIEDRIAQVRRGLDAAADLVLAGTRMRRDRLQGIKTMLYHLAPILVTRDGSISIRDLARATRMDDKTVRRARDAAIEAGLLVFAGRYAGGAKSCDTFAVTPIVETEISRVRSEKSPTSRSTPSPTAPRGRCNATKQDRRHSYERKLWRLLNDALAQLGPGERLATSQTRPAKLLRSMWAQRRWFREMSPQEQQARRSARRKLLRGLDPADLRAWLLWLEQRERIANACDRILASVPDPYDGHLLEHAPMTIYRGMRDPAWRTGGTKIATQPVLVLERTAAA
ncbi:hypothetical protein ACIRRA_39950 [Nocardia sp. NPDC101769]|uniref:hypothetical protein n=1 Tax=Nocardia sp. NPDC101769 TaxID=3364333 RepID=UPI00381EDBCE